MLRRPGGGIQPGGGMGIVPLGRRGGIGGRGGGKKGSGKGNAGVFDVILSGNGRELFSFVDTEVEEFDECSVFSIRG